MPELMADDAVRDLARSVTEARSTGHAEVSAVHVLLSIARHRSAARDLLDAAGADHETVRKQLFPLEPGEIVAPAASQGVDLSKLVGQEIEIETTRFVRPGEGTGVTGRARLVGVCAPTWQLDDPDAAYASDSMVVKWAAQRSGEPEDRYLSTIGYGR